MLTRPSSAMLLLVCLGVAAGSFIEGTANGTTIVIAAEKSVQINSNLVVNGTVTVNNMNVLTTLQALESTLATLNATLVTRILQANVACASSPCLNGGNCSPTITGVFTCQCTFGFAGPTCSWFNRTSIEWGTSGDDYAFSISIDSSKSLGYIAGYTRGTFPGQSHLGNTYDLFMSTVDLQSGAIVQTTQWGTDGYDYAQCIAIDISKSVGFITGWTDGAFPGFTTKGLDDVILSTVNLTSGAVLWTIQWGTGITDYGLSIAIDSSKSMGYVTGWTNGAFPGFTNLGNNDVFLTIINLTSRAVVLTNQWGTNGDDRAFSIAIDVTSSLGYITGWTNSAFLGFNFTGGAYDVLLSTVNLTSGAVVRPAQWGTTGDDRGYSIALDNGKSVGYITGLAAGAYDDVVLITFNLTSGAIIRIGKWGTSSYDVPYSIAIDTSKSVGYITGYTLGAFAGYVNLGGWDSFMSTVNLTSGTAMRTAQWGTQGNELPRSIAIDSSKSLGYVAGNTNGAFAGFNNLGLNDNFLSVTSLSNP